MDVLHVQEAKNCGGFGGLTDRLTRAPCCYRSIPKYGTDVGCQVAQMTDTLMQVKRGCGEASRLGHCSVGRGNLVLFWEDIWINGSSICQLAPSIYDAVPARFRNHRTVAEALLNKRWIQDITGALGMQAILEYLSLWPVMKSIQLSDQEDSLHWRWETSGEYSSRSAYQAQFLGRIRFQSSPIQKSLASPKCRYFIWLVALNRYQTADRLRKRGLPHPAKCVLCDQCEESIDHLLIVCPESCQLWWMALNAIGHAGCLPLSDSSFHLWLCDSTMKQCKEHRRGFDTIVALVAWTIWKERNNRVFNQQQRSYMWPVQWRQKLNFSDLQDWQCRSCVCRTETFGRTISCEISSQSFYFHVPCPLHCFLNFHVNNFYSFQRCTPCIFPKDLGIVRTLEEIFGQLMEVLSNF